VRGSRIGWSALLRLPYLIWAALVVTAFSTAGNVAAQDTLTFLTFGVLTVTGLLFSVWASVHSRLAPADRRPWRYVAAAFGLQFLASVAYSFAVRGVGVPSTPTLLLATVLWFVSCLLLLRAMLLFAGAHQRSARRTWRLVLDMATVLAATFMLLWYFLAGPALTRAVDHAGVLWMGPAAYALADVTLVFGSCAVLLRGTTTSARRPMLLVLTSAILAFARDTVTAYIPLFRSDLPWGGTVWFTVLLPLPLLFLTAAAVEQVRQAGTDRGRPVARLIRRPTWIPYAALGTGFVLLIWAAATANYFPWWGLVAGATVMTGAVAARQISALRENHDLVVTDNLTGLASRVYLRDAMLHLLDRSRAGSSAVLQMDLDGFKRINDVYGHETGDAYLVRFAEVVRGCVRPDDLAARLGGDEFAVVLNGVRDVNEAVGVAERILTRAAEPSRVGEHVLPIRASIGITIASGHDGDVDQILHRADQAMYVAKRRHTHGWQLYAEGTMEDDQDTMRRLLSDVGVTRQLRLAYQPIVELATGRLIALEALVRWQHPTRGLLGPLTFIPLAEEAGSIYEIGLWVVDEASRQVARWQRGLPPGRRLDLSVNLSPRQLTRDTLAGDVAGILVRNDFAADHLIAEITESGLVEDVTAIGQLEQLRANGIRIALDDFGTGYSSLRYLTRLPVDILKLDKCFVAELDGRQEGSAVAVAVVRLAQMLHLDTIAEGIEDQSQATELFLHGYRNGQGYFFARPLVAADVDALLETAGDAPPAPTTAGPSAATTSPGAFPELKANEPRP